jgi:hypothetical protein
MKKIKLICAGICLAMCMNAQDSTKVLNHEIGFNSFSLLGQVSLITNTNVTQLPYDVFYNIYYKDKYGLRLGLGLLSNYTETSLEGQEFPRTTSNTKLNWRLGVSYNFSRMGRITLNGFADFISATDGMVTVVSTTTNVFPNPMITKYVRTEDSMKGNGFQLGVGLRWQMYKQLSLYIEMPYQFMAFKQVTEEYTVETGKPESTEREDLKGFSQAIILPATIYLVLRF